MSSGYWEMKINERREELFDRIEDAVSPLITYTSDTRKREEAMRLGVKYERMMREKKEELEEIDEEIRELEEKKEEIKDKWETPQVKFKDL